MQKLLCLFFFMGIFTLHAESNDPWAEVDKKVYHANLCEAFVDGATYTFENKSCSFFGCDQYPYLVKTFCKVDESGKRVATLEHWNVDGPIYSRETILESDWNEKKGNLLRYRATYVESFGNQFILQKTSTDEDGNLQADFVVHSPNGALIEEGHWVFGVGPSIPQVRERYLKKHLFIAEENWQTLVE